MELEYKKDSIYIKNKVITELDKFVLDFVKFLERFTEYTIVSGYVTILFGRARGTEDIDTLIARFDKNMFIHLFKLLIESDYNFLNSENANELYEMLEEGLAIRIARKNTVIPNIELKFVKDEFDRYSLENKIKVAMNDKHIFISPIELQIPYKLYLGSDKDIEDAIYLWDIFKEKIDLSLLKKFMDKLNVDGEKYGIEI
ncbi:MAG: hypothetical protein FE036_01530 [Thermoplasmata archaeon]|nr:MAG: hypothetical protein FE036_01530 [Thermoplasmata archaeon]